MEINKDILKEYINQKKSDKRITEIIDYKIETRKIYKHMLTPDFYNQLILEYPRFEKDRYIEMTFIKPTWNGWSIVTEKRISYQTKHLIGTFEYRKNRKSNSFNLDNYKNWLRDYKINEILN